MQIEKLKATVTEVISEETSNKKVEEKEFEPYKEYFKFSVIKPRIHKDVMRTCMRIREDEFNNLSPRLIHTESIAWDYPSKGSLELISAHIYITPGIRTVGDKKIDTAYSYFVRYGIKTWKPEYLFDAFNILESIRIWEVNNQVKKKEKEKKFEARKALRKKSS